MVVRVRYFAALREQLGADDRVEWQPGMTLGSLREDLVARGGLHAELLSAQRAVRGSVAQRMALAETPVPDEAEVAFFPPVTGG